MFVTIQADTDTIALRGQKIEISNQGDQFVEVRSVGNRSESGVRVANTSVLALEAERRNNE